jgi:hypothetical protein
MDSSSCFGSDLLCVSAMRCRSWSGSRSGNPDETSVKRGRLALTITSLDCDNIGNIAYQVPCVLDVDCVIIECRPCDLFELSVIVLVS